MILTCPASSNETWGVADSMSMIVGFKWDPDCFFEKLKFFEIGIPRSVFSLNKNKTNTSIDDDCIREFQ